MAGASSPTAATIILVHGGFVDGSGWEGVYKILKKDGYTVSIARIRRYHWPTMSPQPNALFTRRTAR